MSSPKSMLITIIEIWVQRARVLTSANSREDQKGGWGDREKNLARHRRIVMIWSIGISGWRREDWLILRERWNKWAEEKQRDERVRTRRNHGVRREGEREREREVCRILVNSNHRGWYFQRDATGRIYLRVEFTE